MTGEDCRYYESCKAPICPLDEQSPKHSIWYPDEPICRARKDVPADWLKIQKRIAKKARNITRYFTYKDFISRKRVQNPRGHNPDNLLTCHEPK